jgi:hypothetical protein
MRSGMCLIVALAFMGCNNDVPVDTGSSSGTTANVTGSWTVQWHLSGTNAVPDTTITPISGGGADTTITDSTVVDSCVASGTLTLTQATPIATVTGPAAINRTCEGVTVALSDTLRVGTVTPDNGIFFFIDAGHQQGQQGSVSNKSMSGVAVWRGLSFVHPPKAPTKTTITGTWTATSP